MHIHLRHEFDHDRFSIFDAILRHHRDIARHLLSHRRDAIRMHTQIDVQEISFGHVGGRHQTTVSGRCAKGGAFHLKILWQVDDESFAMCSEPGSDGQFGFFRATVCVEDTPCDEGCVLEAHIDIASYVGIWDTRGTEEARVRSTTQLIMRELMACLEAHVPSTQDSQGIVLVIVP